MLSGAPSATRICNHSEIGNEVDDNGWTVRNERYKLINFDNGTQEFYDLIVDSLEVNNLLLVSLTSEQQVAKDDLELEANDQRTSWSCRDNIQNI